ncbi:rhamnogalacturonan acetylesterase [Pontibacter sp. 13R65]|uniref:rhamnogalacturonan acetylesterase n=1 Tax=Pontibacter sp. 13R65 TaxID=3127458 RepID=UPI00301DD1A1
MKSIFLFKKATFTYLLLLSMLLAGASCAVVKNKEEAKPTIFLIGDSTVKNGKGKGDGGLWGWGNFLDVYFDSTKVSVENHALGGTSSRTFRTYGHWEKVLAQLKPGDYVLMQFGHNDSSPVNDTLRARGTLKSNGDETEEIENLITKKHEVVHSYGWYLREFINDTRAKGATPVVLSPVPRNTWNNGQANRNNDTYGQWASEAAAQEGVVYIDLNGIIADRYEEEGEAKVRSTYFNTTDHTHTIEEGAKLNAAAVVAGIKRKKQLPLNKYLSRQGKKLSF